MRRENLNLLLAGGGRPDVTPRMWDNISHDLDVKRGAMGLSMGFVEAFSFEREKTQIFAFH